MLQDNCTVVHISAQMGYAEITEMLIDEYGADPTIKTNVQCPVATLHSM